MKLRKEFNLRTYLLISTFLICLAQSIAADDFPKKIQKKVKESIEIKQNTQKMEDQWMLDKEKLIQKYQTLQLKNQELKSTRKNLKKELSSCQSRIETLKSKIEEANRMNRELIPFMEDTYQKLAGFIENDAPFLNMERTGRMNTLKKVLNDGKIRTCEKFRKLMEAVFVEAEYGKTIEVYHERINFQGKTIMANILRLGRISIFFRTPDHRTTGFFNTSESIWKIFPKKYNRAVNQAFDIGAKRRSADIICLPLGRIVTP